MMRNIYYILIIVAFLSGCSKSYDVPDGSGDDMQVIPGSYIFFDAQVVETKSVVNLFDQNVLPRGTTAFGVYGVRRDGKSIFESYTSDNSILGNLATVYRSSNVFQYDKLALWHDGEHKFLALYVNGLQKSNSTYHHLRNIIDMVGTDMTGSSPEIYARYIHPNDIYSMVDLMTAFKTSKPTASEIVFDFGHKLFSLDVMLDNNSSSDLKVKHASVEFQVYNKYHLYSDKVVVPDDAEVKIVSHTFIDGDTSVNFTPEALAYNLNDKSSWPDGSVPEDESSSNYHTFLFPPLTSEQPLKVKLKLTFENTWGEEVTFPVNDAFSEVKLEGGFQAGRSYELIFRREDGGSDMTFIPSVIETWGETPDVDHTFN